MENRCRKFLKTVLKNPIENEPAILVDNAKCDAEGAIKMVQKFGASYSSETCLLYEVGFFDLPERM
jgi:hypothetical protein